MEAGNEEKRFGVDRESCIILRNTDLIETIVSTKILILLNDKAVGPGFPREPCLLSPAGTVKRPVEVINNEFIRVIRWSAS